MNHEELLFNGTHPHDGKAVAFAGFDCLADFAHGYANGGTAIALIDANDGMHVTTATVWLENLAPDEVAIKDYSENEGVLAALLKAEIVTPPHRHVRAGFVTIPVCRLA